MSSKLSDAVRASIIAALKADKLRSTADVAREFGTTAYTVAGIRRTLPEEFQAKPEERQGHFNRERAERLAPILAQVEAEIRANPAIGTAELCRKYSLAKSTVQRFRETLPEEFQSDPAERRNAAIPRRERTTDEDREVVKLRAEVTTLRKKVKDHITDKLNDDAIRTLLGSFREHEPTPPTWTAKAVKRGEHGTPEVPVLMLADWHNGEVVQPGEIHGINHYDMKTCRERVHNVVDGAIHLARNVHKQTYPGAVIPLVGDLVSGMLHPELMKTDELNVIPAALETADLAGDALDRLKGEFKKLYVPCVAGNHGRNTFKPEFKNYSYKNFDWLIYQMLIRRFKGDPNVVIECPPTNEVHFRVYGKRFMLVHGDMLGVQGGDGIIGVIGPIMRGENKVGRQASSIGKDFDILLMGHWHQQLWLPRCIVGNTLKGFDEYAKNKLRATPTPPSQALFFVHPRRGITSRWEVQADAPTATEASEWVSVFNN